MKRLKLFLFLSLVLQFGYGQSTARLGGSAANGEYMGFLQFLPDNYNAPNTKFPLIIFLHGIGEKGNGTTQLNDVLCCGLPSYLKEGNNLHFTWGDKTESFVVLAPQLNPKYGVWQNFYVDELINYALRTLKVDPDRIFLTGLSLGGGGTWSYASTSLTNAEKLAGIVPVAAPCFIRTACNIAKSNLPVFALHAIDDTIAPVRCTVSSVAAINNCKPSVSPNVLYYPDGGHNIFMKRAFDTEYTYQNPNIFEWMLAQRKNEAPNKKPIAKLDLGGSITNGKGIITLSGQESYDPDGELVRCNWERLSGPELGKFESVGPGLAIITGLTTPGIYRFVMKVVDDRAEWTTDTASINLSATTTKINISPVANAGTNQTIYQPAKTATLNGMASKDPDQTIYLYQWKKIDGPSSGIISSPNKAITPVTNLVPGTYTFQLRVIDIYGASSYDEMEITVKGDGSEIVPPIDNGDINNISNAAVSFSPDYIFGVQTGDRAFQEKQLQIYPNPVSAFLQLQLPVTTDAGILSDVKVYNAAGNMMYTGKIGISAKLSVRNYPPGIYFIQVFYKDHMYKGTFIKK